jgi:hypothetical protein
MVAFDIFVAFIYLVNIGARQSGESTAGRRDNLIILYGRRDSKAMKESSDDWTFAL